MAKGIFEELIQPSNRKKPDWDALGYGGKNAENRVLYQAMFSPEQLADLAKLENSAMEMTSEIFTKIDSLGTAGEKDPVLYKKLLYRLELLSQTGLIPLEKIYSIPTRPNNTVTYFEEAAPHRFRKVKRYIGKYFNPDLSSERKMGSFEIRGKRHENIHLSSPTEEGKNYATIEYTETPITIQEEIEKGAGVSIKSILEPLL